jgi:hypothetical protein
MTRQRSKYYEISKLSKFSFVLSIFLPRTCPCSSTHRCPHRSPPRRSRPRTRRELIFIEVLSNAPLLDGHHVTKWLLQEPVVGWAVHVDGSDTVTAKRQSLSTLEGHDGTVNIKYT